MKKHILVVSQYFYPEQFRINDMCAEWVKRGYKVTVVTGIPNYPEGRFYKGYGWFKNRHEDYNGVDVIRIPIFARGKSKFGMVMNYLSFVVSGFFWKVFSKIKADIVFTFEVSPMTQALVGVWYAKKHKIPHYIYVQDLWPENVEIVTGIHNKAIINPISKMVDYIYKNSQMIFATSPSFVEEIRKRVSKEEANKVVFWPQYAEDFYVPLENENIDTLPDGVFKIAFTGNVGQAQGLEVLPKTAKILQEQGIETVRFVIVGDGRYKEKLLSDISELSVQDYFIMIDRQPAEEIPKYLACCDVAFVSFMDNPLFEKTIPAKLQSYMACAKPILASASGETRRIIEESGCGICCNLGDEYELASAIVKMINMDLEKMAAASLEYFQSNFTKVALMDQMDDYLGLDDAVREQVDDI